jgi:hypothetical protein
MGRTQNSYWINKAKLKDMLKDKDKEIDSLRCEIASWVSLYEFYRDKHAEVSLLLANIEKKQQKNGISKRNKVLIQP